MAEAKKYGLGLILGLVIAALVLGSGITYIVFLASPETFVRFAGVTSTPTTPSTTQDIGAQQQQIEAYSYSYQKRITLTNQISNSTASATLLGKLYPGVMFYVDSIEGLRSSDEGIADGLSNPANVNEMETVFGQSLRANFDTIKAETGVQRVTMSDEVAGILLGKDGIAMRDVYQPSAALIDGTSKLAWWGEKAWE